MRKWQGSAVFLLVIGFTMIFSSPADLLAAAKPVRSSKKIYDHPRLNDTITTGGYRTTGLSLNARSALVVDNRGGGWIYAKQPQQVAPIASLTKLLTIMVYLDMEPNLDTIVYISARDCYQSSRSRIRKGEGYKAIDLLHAALMASDNRAARAIATASGLPRQIFVDKMNEKARSLGMTDTRVYEVTGLDERNVATASDIAILIREAMKYPLISKISAKDQHFCKARHRKSQQHFKNTNRLIGSKWKVLVGKTGYIIESGYCLATILADQLGHEVAIVVMGSPSNGSRFSVTRKLAEYAFKLAGRNINGNQQITGG